jgi:hypothetical protein
MRQHPAPRRTRLPGSAYETWILNGTAYIAPAIEPEMPARLRQGIERRALAAITGLCPCGAGLEYQPSRFPRDYRTQTLHLFGCPAGDPDLWREAEAWHRDAAKGELT